MMAVCRYAHGQGMWLLCVSGFMPVLMRDFMQASCRLHTANIKPFRTMGGYPLPLSDPEWPKTEMTPPEPITDSKRLKICGTFPCLESKASTP